IRSCDKRYNNNPNIIKLLLNNSNNLNLNLKNIENETALIKLFKNKRINKIEKLELFNLFLTYKYNKLNLKENDIYELINNEKYIKKEDKFEYKEVLYFYNSPNEFNFYKFQIQEY